MSAPPELELAYAFSLVGLRGHAFFVLVVFGLVVEVFLAVLLVVVAFLLVVFAVEVPATGHPIATSAS